MSLRDRKNFHIYGFQFGIVFPILCFVGFIFWLLLCGCEPQIVYIEKVDTLAVEIETPRLTSSVVSLAVSHVNGIPYISATGRVKNYGPGRVTNVRIIVETDLGSIGLSMVSPSALSEGSSGTWSVSGLRGSRIKSKAVLYN